MWVCCRKTRYHAAGISLATVFFCENVICDANTTIRTDTHSGCDHNFLNVVRGMQLHLPPGSCLWVGNSAQISILHICTLQTINRIISNFVWPCWYLRCCSTQSHIGWQQPPYKIRSNQSTLPPFHKKMISDSGFLCRKKFCCFLSIFPHAFCSRHIVALNCALVERCYFLPLFSEHAQRLHPRECLLNLSGPIY